MFHKNSFSLSALKYHLFEYTHPTRRSHVRLFDLDKKRIIRNLYNYAPFAKLVKTERKDIIAFCSTIHLPSIAALNFLKMKLCAHDIHLEIVYFQNSSEAIASIEGYNKDKKPVLITVTEGTAAKLEMNSEYNYYKAIESIPGLLQWSSPQKIYDWKKINQISFHTFQHPTDIIAQNQFINFLCANNLIINTKENINSENLFTPLYDMPEEESYYNNLQKNHLTLSVDMLDKLSLNNQRNEIYKFPYWRFLEKRFIYFNEHLLNLEPERDFAKHFQSLIYDTLISMAFRFHKFDWENILLRNTELEKNIKQYLKKQ